MITDEAGELPGVSMLLSVIEISFDTMLDTTLDIESRICCGDLPLWYSSNAASTCFS